MKIIRSSSIILETLNIHPMNDFYTPIYPGILLEPTLYFAQRVWWDALLEIYMSHERDHTVEGAGFSRESVTRRIIDDVRFLFRVSTHWFSFIHVPRFFSKFLNPTTRLEMQPSLALAMCSLSVFLQSSELEEGGERGRKLALKLRDEAQSTLESSVNASWLTDELAQAAWVSRSTD